MRVSFLLTGLLSACLNIPTLTSPPPPGTAGAPNRVPEAVLELAARDPPCTDDGVRLLQIYDRRYANGTDLRYLVEGCGQRALYGESCEIERRSYFLASRLSVQPPPRIAPSLSASCP